MNEQIKQLLKQATDTVEIVNPDTGITHHREFFDKEKFAELIVRECVDVVKWTPSMFPNDKIIKNIKEHFGVEE